MPRPTFIALASFAILAAAGLSPVRTTRNEVMPLAAVNRLSHVAMPTVASVVPAPPRNQLRADLAREPAPIMQANERRMAPERERSPAPDPPVNEKRSVNIPQTSATSSNPPPSIASGSRPSTLAGRTGSGTWAVHGRTSTVTCRFSASGRVAWRTSTETIFGGWSQHGSAVTFQAGPISAVGALDDNRLVLRCHTIGVGDGVATLTFDE